MISWPLSLVMEKYLVEESMVCSDSLRIPAGFSFPWALESEGITKKTPVNNRPRMTIGVILDFMVSNLVIAKYSP